MHEVLPHGAQILLELLNASPSPDEIQDLVLGAKEGSILYLRMAEWALGQDSLANAILLE